MLPQDLNKLKLLNKYVNQAVSLLHEKDTITEDLSELKNIVEEEVGKEYAKTFKATYDARYKAEKVQEEIDKKTTALEESEELMKHV